MNVTVENKTACRKILKIEIPVEKVAEEFKEMTRAMAKAANLPGFRPGRAPLPLVEKRFAKEIVEEVRDRLARTAYRDAIAEQKIEPVAVVDAKPSEPKPGEVFRLEVTLDVSPEFTLPDYEASLRVEPKPVVVTEQEIDDGIKDIRRRNGSIVEVTDRGAQTEDFVQIDYAGTCEGKPVKELGDESAARFGEGRDFWTMLGAQEFLPGISEGLAGIKIGETRQVAVTFPGDFRIKALADKRCDYTITAKQIRARQLSEMDEIFLKDNGAATVDELRAKVKESLQTIGELGEQRRVRSEVLAWLLAQTDLKELPAAIVANETGRELRAIVQENLQRGVAEKDLEDRKDEIYNAAVSSSSERVKLDYILGRIADREKIAVTDAELQAEVERMATRYGMTPARLRAELVKRDALDEVRSDLRESKAIERLVELAQRKEAKA